MELREKKQKRCQSSEVEGAGDMWDHTAVTADSKLVVSLVVGKRTSLSPSGTLATRVGVWSSEKGL
jgi:hypothetical protein